MIKPLILDITPHNRPVLGFIAEAQGICAVLGMLVVQKFTLASHFFDYLFGACIGFCILNWVILGFFRYASRDPENLREFGRINLLLKPLLSINWIWDTLLLFGSIMGGIGVRLIISLIFSNSMATFYLHFSIQGLFTIFLFFIVLLFGLIPDSMMQIGTANQRISGFYWLLLWRKGLFVIVIGVLAWIIHIPQNILFLSVLYFAILTCSHYFCILLYLHFKPLVSFLFFPAVLVSCSLLS